MKKIIKDKNAQLKDCLKMSATLKSINVDTKEQLSFISMHETSLRKSLDQGVFKEESDIVEPHGIIRNYSVDSLSTLSDISDATPQLDFLLDRNEEEEEEGEDN